MWLQLVAIAIGLWVPASEYVFECDGPTATNLYIVGPIVASIACIAIWEVMRPLRWLNLLLGVWLAISPLLLNYPTAAAANAAVSGIMITVLACVRDVVRHRFGGGWSSLWREQAG